MSFDYGSKLPDGQHERHPTNTEGEYVAPIRNKYIHSKCGVVTQVGSAIADTYARNPTFYSRTFCIGCGEYFPISEFNWTQDNVELGKIL